MLGIGRWIRILCVRAPSILSAVFSSQAVATPRLDRPQQERLATSNNVGLSGSAKGFLAGFCGIRLARGQGDRGINATGTPVAFMPRKPLDALPSGSHFGQLVGMAFASPPAASRRVRGLGQSPRLRRRALPFRSLSRVGLHPFHGSREPRMEPSYDQLKAIGQTAAPEGAEDQ